MALILVFVCQSVIYSPFSEVLKDFREWLKYAQQILPNTAAEKKRNTGISLQASSCLNVLFCWMSKPTCISVLAGALLTTFRGTFLGLFDYIHQPYFHLLSTIFCCGRQLATSLCEVFTINGTKPFRPSTTQTNDRRQLYKSGWKLLRTMIIMTIMLSY